MRLTKDLGHGIYTVGNKLIEGYTMFGEPISKLGQLEDIEEDLGIDLITLFKAIENGFYYRKESEIYFCRWCIRVGSNLVETSPCYAVKNTTLKSCYLGDVEEVVPVEDAHYWSWKTSRFVRLKDYGKTWALTREELE